MKITCTKAEKDWLMESIMESETRCFFLGQGDLYCKCDMTCKDCLEKNIEFEITD